MINLKKLVQTGKFFWPGSETEWIQVRVMPKSEVKKLLKEQLEKKAEYHQDKSGKVHRVEFNEIKSDEAIEEAIIDYQIESWRILDENGGEIDCTKANKLLLMQNSYEFEKFVTESIDRLRNDQTKKEEDRQKN